MAPRTRAGEKRAHSPDAATSAKDVTPVNTGQPVPAAKRVRTSSLLDSAQTRTPIGGQSASNLEAKATVGKATAVGARDDEQGKGNGVEMDQDPASIFPGSYDLYGMKLPFMVSAYVPAGGPLNPEALYKTMLEYQAKNDQNAQITIPEDYASSRKEGTFECDLFCEPMDGEPLDISFSTFKNSDKMPFKSEYGRPVDAWDGPSISGKLEADGGGCGIKSSSGSLTMQPLWKKIDTDGELMEIFEGIFTMKVSYTSKFSNRGYGSGQKQTIKFWAVRA